jgi:DNA-directed RNA polymerase subunit RPC12/RpoP
MIVGYAITGEDNDSYMCASCDRVFPDMPGLNVCPKCGYRTDIFYTNPAFKLTRTKFDFSHTYDGACIVSERFKEFCIRHHFESLEFRALPAAKGFYHFIVHRIVPFDTITRKTRFGDLCPTCGFYESVAGATPSFLRVSAPLADGFWRSDILFGSRNEKHPLIFVGTSTKELMERERFAEIHFDPTTSVQLSATTPNSKLG